MSRSWLVLGAGLAGCVSETWIYAPTAEVVVDATDVTAVDGVALLTYDADALPDADAEVSNALRLTVRSSIGDHPTLEFPDAERADLVSFERSGALNLVGVYAPCGEPRCVVEVPFRVVRSSGVSAELTIAGDAILSAASPVHQTRPSSDAATLELYVLP